MTKTQSDEHGEYKPDAGSPHPVEEDDVGYVPCNAVLRHTWSRYGERRFCTAMAIENFQKNGKDTSYEHADFCKNHQDRAALMKQHEEEFKTGAYAKSHEHKFQHLPPHKQILANDLYKSLIEESTFNFEMESTELEVDVAESDFAPDADTLVLDHKIPTAHEIRAKALWFAALDFITMESIREEQFRVAAEESFDGRSLAIGERVKTVSVTDDGQPIKDTDEHHLNLPLSRIQSDYAEHLRFGGVTFETDDDTASMGAREWVAVVEPEEPEPMPESQSGDSSPLHEIEVPEDDEN